MHFPISMFVAACLLPAFAALGTFEAGSFDASSSLVFGNSGGLVVAANDVSVSRFSCDDDNLVTRSETLVGDSEAAGGRCELRMLR